MSFDVIIKNGFIVDGTGASGRIADLGISQDRIEAIGDLSHATAPKIIDATGKVVCPGFIDVHVHSELSLLYGEDRYAPLKMGVTTQLASPDGFAWSALSEARLQEQKAYLHVFYDDPMIPTTGDMSIDKWLSLYDGKLPSNLVLQIPHGSIRVETMGWEARPANEDELKMMGRKVDEWMDAGALAFCTGLEYEPMRRADLRELVYLSKVAARRGGLYVAHQRGYAEKVRIGCQETFAIAEQAQLPVHISHFTVDELAADQLEEARNREIQVTFDMYPYPAGCTHLLMGLPETLQQGTPEQVLERIRSASIREQYREALTHAFPIDLIRFAAVGIEQPTGWEGKSLREVALELGMEIHEAICEILLRTELQALMIYHWPEDRHGYLESTFKHPSHMVSTDGIYIGRKPHPRGYGTYPKVLGQYVREKQWLELEQAIYKMTGFPAQTFKLKQRGTLKPQHFADIVVFDPGKIRDLATFAEPRQDPIGIEYVLVNGTLIVEKGTVHPELRGCIVS